MELIFGIILMYFAVWLVMNVIWPYGVGAAAIAGAAVGLWSALKNYWLAIKKHSDPYAEYVDRARNRQAYALRRNYFFGPGLCQLRGVIRDAWKGMRFSAAAIGGFRNRINGWTYVPVLRMAVRFFSWIFYWSGLLSVGLAGGAVTAVLAAAHSLILFVAMAATYLVFSVTWLVDRLYLKGRYIKALCPVCQQRTRVPAFACSGCLRIHDRLVPGPYGVFRRTCVCGEKLPTTFLLGRSRLNAYCARCGHPVASSDARQFALSVVGGTASGKTTLLTAFYHKFFERLQRDPSGSVSIPAIHRDIFDDMAAWYRGAPCESTARDRTSTPYSVLLQFGAQRGRWQFTLYDIAGEALSDDGLRDMLPQRQMRDSDGVVVVVDPAASGADAAAAVGSYASYLKTVMTAGSLREKSEKPVAVVIAKTDLTSVSRYISYHKIKLVMRENPGRFASLTEARDTLCREYLEQIGLEDVVRQVEANFMEAHYFPVSAIGHPANGEAFEPQHALEPFFWLIRRGQPDLAEALGIAEES